MKFEILKIIFLYIMSGVPRIKEMRSLTLKYSLLGTNLEVKEKSEHDLAEISGMIFKNAKAGKNFILIDPLLYESIDFLSPLAQEGYKVFKYKKIRSLGDVKNLLKKKKMWKVSWK